MGQFFPEHWSRARRWAVGSGFALMLFIGIIVGSANRDHSDDAEARSDASSRSSSAANVNGTDDAAERAFRSRLDDLYGQDQWWGRARVLSVRNGNVTVQTDLFPDTEGHGQGVSICNIVSSLAHNRLTQYDFGDVTIMGQGDNILAASYGRGSACEALD